MTNQTELTQGLVDVKTTLVTIGTGVTTLVQKVADLELALTTAGTLTPELVTAFDDVKSTANGVLASIPTV